MDRQPPSPSPWGERPDERPGDANGRGPRFGGSYRPSYGPDGRGGPAAQPPLAGPVQSTGDADGSEDTQPVPAASLGAIIDTERAAGSHLDPQGHEPGDERAISTARRRRYAEKMQSVAEIDTVQLLAQTDRPARRPSSGLSSLWQTPWVRTGLLMVGLVLLLARAAMASSAFMAPGGGIIGWSVVPKTTSPFKQVTPPPTQQHELTPSEYAALLVQQLSLDQELGQMIIVQLRGRDPGPDDNVMIASEGAGGILYFAFNIQSASQVRASTAQVQKWAPIPLLLSVDQEGGPVNRFSSIVGPLPSAASLTSTDQARARGQQDAGILHDNGFNLNLAPVADVGTSNPQLYRRTFGSDPARVAAMAGAYLDGLQADGTVTGTVKHYPGLGATDTDPHRGLPVLNRSRIDWERIDLEPYRQLLATQDVRSIMVTHVMIPAVDPDLPSSLSPAIIDSVLRQELGFQGVVITDDVFNMEALSERYPGPQAAVLAVVAGADEIIGPSSPQTMRQTIGAMKQAIASGQLTKERIDLSVRRILTLKIEMGLIPLPKTTTTPTPTPSPKPHASTGPAANRPTETAPRG